MKVTTGQEQLQSVKMMENGFSVHSAEDKPAEEAIAEEHRRRIQENRKRAIERYRKKRTRRVYKRLLYPCRRYLNLQRERVKGRFVKSKVKLTAQPPMDEISEAALRHLVPTSPSNATKPPLHRSTMPEQGHDFTFALTVSSPLSYTDREGSQVQPFQPLMSMQSPSFSVPSTLASPLWPVSTSPHFPTTLSTDCNQSRDWEEWVETGERRADEKGAKGEYGEEYRSGGEGCEIAW